MFPYSNLRFLFVGVINHLNAKNPIKNLPFIRQILTDMENGNMQTADTKITYDAIVIGSGISGGWAAKELCDLGLKTLVLERGRNVEHVKDYPTATTPPWDFKHRGRMTTAMLKDNPYIS